MVSWYGCLTPNLYIINSLQFSARVNKIFNDIHIYTITITISNASPLQTPYTCLVSKYTETNGQKKIGTDLRFAHIWVSNVYFYRVSSVVRFAGKFTAEVTTTHTPKTTHDAFFTLLSKHFNFHQNGECVQCKRMVLKFGLHVSFSLFSTRQNSESIPFSWHSILQFSNHLMCLYVFSFNYLFTFHFSTTTHKYIHTHTPPLHICMHSTLAVLVSLSLSQTRAQR